ncbi:unnamed protein product [Rotaria sp. Silwood2]|nr:unnamed protein product [Rotaria sp. Silwood2]CAF2935835.1 unnamed protein product [Rotaria sp. Silwood2]CAF4372136.1 unnamed protein product [Rotaria sp. Silwood2]
MNTLNNNDVNILDPFYVRHLDLTVLSLLNDNSPVNNQIFDRIRTKILPQIHNRVTKLPIEPLSMKCILNAIDYLVLTSLSLVNFQSETLFHHLTGDNILLRLFTNQITHLEVSICDKKRGAPGRNEVDIFSLMLSIGKCLTDLAFGLRWIDERIEFSFFDLPSTTCVSSSLTKLVITLHTFDDCLHLLDGRLKHLSMLIIDIMKIRRTSPNIDNNKNLPELKCFSLRSHWYTCFYDNRIVPLLPRMLNLEELTLFLSVITNESTYIDGTQLYNDFLIYMPQLSKFYFSMHTNIFNNDIDIDHPSNNDILKSFIKRGYQQVNSYADDQLTYKNWSCCHVYSLPYHFNDFLFMTSRFQGGMFNKVRCLVMDYARPFENELFKIISQDFPFLESLPVVNRASQKNKEHSSTFITFSHLLRLDLAVVHTDYAVKFLFGKNTSLPRLMHLDIKFETLVTVTEGFTNDAARRTYTQIESLVIWEPFVCPENFFSYFS